MGTSNETELSYREKYEQLLRENKSMAAGSDLSNQAYEKLMGDAQNLQTQNARLQADLSASNMSLTRLGAEINSSGQAANREVERLRYLCKKHGIDPNEG